MNKWKCLGFCVILIFLFGCDGRVLNNPYPSADDADNTYYSDFAERPQTLDPARSYEASSTAFIAQIYEPPLQYHFLKRPYELVPLTAAEMPKPKYVDINGKIISPFSPDALIAYTYYDIKIIPGIFYQPHPAFAKDERGNYLYHHLTKEEVKSRDSLFDFEKTGTRELIAEDYVYEIKRLANPLVQSPILSLMEKYILGLEEYAEFLQKTFNSLKLRGDVNYLDLRQYRLNGVEILDRYTYRIILKGKYPQFMYWLAMPFFSPVPWEADVFYSQKGMETHNINFDWFPVGTGPYMMTENNPNRRIVMQRNPNFHAEVYPTSGEIGDEKAGYLKNAGMKLPFVDNFIFYLEPESIPRWNKFLQGYYDRGGLSSDSFDQAVHMTEQGEAVLTAQMQKQGIQLQSSVASDLFYLGFNLLDDVVGGTSERARLLREAIAAALDYDEFISIFLNGRGIAAQGPIPPGILGFQAGKNGINPYVYDWKNNRPVRKPLSYAKELMVLAGYPNGIDPKTGRPLILNYDVTGGTGPDEISQFDWLRKQFSQLGIQLNIRVTNFNRLQEKFNTGDTQLFFMGWSADYPDPENFLFLFYGPNGKVRYGGENITNFDNSKFDELFKKIKNEENVNERLKLIVQAVNILRHDVPVVFGFHRKIISLSHVWNDKFKPSEMANNTLKYVKFNPVLREKLRAQWNQPLFWPLLVIILILILGLLPVVWHYWKTQHQKPRMLDMD